jgi:hypothetical protein
MNVNMEEFRDVKGYEGFYQVSNYGRIKSLARVDSRGNNRAMKFLSFSNDRNIYSSVSLSKNGKHKNYSIHVLVAIAFLNHKPCGHKIHVDHIDNDKSNNILSNLQLITHRKNVSKDKKPSRSIYTGVTYTGKKASKPFRARIGIDGKMVHLGYFKCEKDAGIAYEEAVDKLKVKSKHNKKS